MTTDPLPAPEGTRPYNSARLRREPNAEDPITRRGLRLPDAKWDQLEQIGQTLLPKRKKQAAKRMVSYSYALELLLDHVSEREIREWVEARRMTARKHGGSAQP